jgi:hypothetical protein
MEKEEKKMTVSEFYSRLTRKEKGRFTLWIMMVTGYSMSTVMLRFKHNDWSPLIRKGIEDAIETGAWQKETSGA